MTNEALDRKGLSPEPSRLHPSLEGKVRIEPIRHGGIEKHDLLADITRKPVNIGETAQFMVERDEFSTLPESQPYNLVIARVDVMVPNPKGPLATTEEIDNARDEKGLQPIPAETLLHFLLQKGDQLQMHEWIVASMKPLAASDGNPFVFSVVRYDDGLWLVGYWAGPDGRWNPGYQFAFGLPQVNKT